MFWYRLETLARHENAFFCRGARALLERTDSGGLGPFDHSPVFTLAGHRLGSCHSSTDDTSLLTQIDHNQI